VPQERQHDQIQLVGISILRLPCTSAVTDWSVCRVHGAGDGAPLGKRNGNYRHGGRTIEAMSLRAEINALVRESRELLSRIEA
jgi:hypothetical protein